MLHQYRMVAPHPVVYRRLPVADRRPFRDNGNFLMINEPNDWIDFVHPGGDYGIYFTVKDQPGYQKKERVSLLRHSPSQEICECRFDDGEIHRVPFSRYSELVISGGD